MVDPIRSKAVKAALFTGIKRRSESELLQHIDEVSSIKGISVEDILVKD